jgi:hypothetical protein
MEISDQSTENKDREISDGLAGQRTFAKIGMGNGLPPCHSKRPTLHTEPHRRNVTDERYVTCHMTPS